MSRETTSSDGAEEPTLAVGTTDGDSALPTPLGDLGLGVGTRVAKVVIAGDGVHVGIVGAPATDPFAAELMIWNRATNSVTERIPLAGDASTANWVFGDSDRLALVTSEGLEFRDLGATVLSRASFEPAEAVLALTAVDHGGIVSQHSDGSVRLWSARGDLVTVLGHGLGSLGELRTAPGDSITAVDATGRIRAWSASDGRLLLDHDGFARGAVNDLTSSADGHTVAAASSTGRVRVIDATSDTHPPGDASGRAAAVIDHGGRNVDSVAFDPTGALLATGVGERLGEGVFDDSVGIWTTPRSTAEERSAIWLQGEEKLVPGCTFFRNIVRFAPAGGLLATSSHDDIIEIWDSADGSLVQRLPAHESGIHGMTFSPDGRFLASSSDDSTLRIWDVEGEQVDRTLDTVPGGYWSLEYLPDGDALVVSGISGVVSVIDVRDGSTQRTFEGTKSRLSTLAVSGDGRLVSAGDDLGGVVVWSTASGRRVARVDGHAEPVRSTTFTNDGATLVSGSQDGTIRAWTLRHDA